MTDNLNLDETNASPALKLRAEIQPPAPFDPARHREGTRGLIAISLVVLFPVLVGFLVVAVTFGWLDPAALEKLPAVLLGPVTSLVGAVVGFYFGEQSQRRSY